MITTGESGRWRQVAGVLLAELERLTDPLTRAARLQEVGDLFRDKLDEPLTAARYYADSVKARPEAPHAGLSRLAGLARSTGDVVVTAHLVAGLSAAGQWVDVVTVLVRQAEAASDGAERAGLYLEAAELTRIRIGDPGLAREYLLAAAPEVDHESDAMGRRIIEQLEIHLVHRPDDHEVAAQLARLDVIAGRPAEALAALVLTAAHAPDPSAKASLLLDASIIAGDRADRPIESAIHAYEAYAFDPSRLSEVTGRLEATLSRWGAVPEVADTLEQIFERLGRPDRVDAVMEARLVSASPVHRPELLRRLAEHAEYRLLDPARAFEVYRRGLEERQGDLGAFAAGMRRVGAEGVEGAGEVMIDLFRRLCLWRALVHVLEGEAAVAALDPDRAELLFQAGEILEKHLEDHEAAMAHYLQAFKLRPKEARYLASGERLYRRRDDWPMVARLLDLQLRLSADPAHRRHLLLEQARVSHRHLGEIIPAYDAARQALEAGAGEAATRLLSELTRDEDAFFEIETSLRARAAEEGGTEAARLLAELATLQDEHRGDAAAALKTLSEASAIAPDDLSLFERVAALLRSSGSALDLASFLASARDRAFETARRVDALREASTLFAERLDRPADAREVLQVAAGLAPDDAEVVTALLEQARLAEDPYALAGVLARVAAGQYVAIDGLDRDGALRALAETYAVSLGDLQSASDCHRTLLVDRPADPVSLPWMRDFLRSRGAFDDLRTLLDAAIEAVVDSPRQVEVPVLLRELAELAELDLHDARLAAVYYRQLWESARLEVARVALHRIYAEAGDREGALGLLVMELSELEAGLADGAAPDSEGKERLAEKLIDLAERTPRDIERLTLGLTTLSEVRRDDPDVLDALLGVLEEANDHVRMVVVLAERARLAEPPLSSKFLRERAVLLTSPLAALDLAIAAWSELLEAAESPIQPELRDEALRYLQGIFSSRLDHASELRILGQRVAFAPTEEVAVVLRREAAVQAELRLGDLPRAVLEWQGIFELRPDDAEAVEELLRLYEELEDWSRFVPLAVFHLASLDTTDPDEAVELARRVARLVGDAAVAPGGSTPPSDAIVAWQRVCDREPDDVEAHTAIAELASLTGESALRAHALGRVAASTEDLPERCRLWTLQAQAHEDAGGIAEAIDALRRINQVVPDNRMILAELRRLAIARQDDWTLCRTLEAELLLTTDVNERLVKEKELARRLDHGLGDQESAVLAWERVLVLRPDDREAHTALKDLFVELGRPNDLVRALRRLLELAVDDNERVVRLSESARLIELHKGDQREAFECWWRAFKLCGEADPRMLREMGRIAEAADLWDRYIKVLDVARERAHTHEQQIEVLIQQARVAEERLREPARALTLLQRAFDLDPRPGRAFDELLRVAPLVGQHDAMLEAINRLLKAGVDREHRSALLLRSAVILETQLQDPERAFEAYALASRAGAPDEAVLPELVRLAEAHGTWDALVDIYNDKWNRQTQMSARIGTLRALAELLETRALDWERAFEQYMIALQLDPEDEATRTEVWRLADAHGAWPLVLRVFELKIKDADEIWLKIALLHDVARIQERKLGQPEKAFETLRRAFGLETWNESTHAALRRLASDLSRWGELAAAFVEEASWAEEPLARLRLLREAAALLEAHGDRAEAARVLRQVVDLDGQDEIASSALSAAYHDLGDHTGLAELLEARLVRAVEASRRPILLELLALYRGPLSASGRGGSSRVRTIAQKLLAITETDELAFDALEEVYLAALDYRELAELLETRVRCAPAEKRGPLLERRADLLHHRLGRPREAFAVLLRAAQAEPSRLDLVTRLTALAEGNDELEELIGCAERALETSDPDASLPLLLLAGRTSRDRFSNRKRARLHLARALELTPDDRSLALEVLELQTGEKRWAEVVALLERYGPQLSVDALMDDRTATINWTLRLAELKADRLADQDAAISTLLGAVRAYPDSAAIVDRLYTLADQARNIDAMVTAINCRVRSAGTNEAIAAAAISGALALGTLEAQEPALLLWQRALKASPHNSQALEAIRVHATRNRDWGLLRQQLKQRALASAEPLARATAFNEYGAFERERGDEPGAALEAYQQALLAQPFGQETLEALLALLREKGDVAAVIAMTTELLSALAGEGDLTPYRHLDPVLAQLQHDRGLSALADGLDTDAVAFLSDAHRRAPTHEAISLALGEALYRDGELVRAAAIWAEFPSLPPLPAGLDASAHKGREYLRRGRAFFAAGQVDRALRAFEAAALEPVSRVESLEALANLQERGGHWETAVRYREKLGEASTAAGARSAAYIAAGIIVETRLGKPQRAATYYERALQSGLSDRHLLGRVLSFYREQSRYDEALAINERLLIDEVEPNARADGFTLSGELQARAGRPALARLAFRAALDASPLLLPAVRGLLASCEGADDADQRQAFRAIWEGTLGITGPERRPVLEALGQALLGRDDVAGALEVYEDLHNAVPDAPEVQQILARLYLRLVQADSADPNDVDHFHRAIRHRLSYLRSFPGDVESLRDLVTLYRGAGQSHWGATPLRLLVLLRQATREETELCRAMGGPLDERPGLVLDQATRIDLINESSWSTPAAMLLKVLYETLSEAIDHHQGALRLDPDEMAAHPPPNLLGLVEGLCQSLELPTPVVHVRPVDERRIVVDRLHPMELVVDRGLAVGTPPRDQRFLMARVLEGSRGAGALAFGLSPDDGRALFAAAMALGLGDDGAEFALETGADPELISTWADFLVEHLDEAELEALSAYAFPVRVQGPSAFDQWLIDTRCRANRVAFVLSGDLSRSLTIIMRDTPELTTSRISGPEGFRGLLSRSAELTDLHNFVFGTKFHALLGALPESDDESLDGTIDHSDDVTSR